MPSQPPRTDRRSFIVGAAGLAALPAAGAEAGPPPAAVLDVRGMAW
ncbi:MAG: hypothetical protein NT029_17345 [Armatimonadetes bacterium]|nr:hypothetical protein [Armatimonadota bacterium]